MSCCKLRDNPFFLQHAPHGGAHGQDRRLGIFRQLQLLVGAFKAELRDGEAQRLVGFLKGVARYRIERGQLFAHSRCL